MAGKELLEMLVSGTGLPKDMVMTELRNLIDQKGLCEDNLTMDDVRTLLEAYLQDTILNAKKEFAAD